MKSKREEAAVGLFILIAAALLIGTGLVKADLSSGGIPHYAFFKTAGGLHEGAKVRYGGMDAGKVNRVRVDPQDSTRIEIDFTVQNGIPVKTDSIAKTAALGALGENYLEIGTGTKGAPLASSGSELLSAETVGIGDLAELIGGLEPDAKLALKNLNKRLEELQITLANANDLLNKQNRANVSESLGNLNSILSDGRPKIAATLTSVQTAAAQLPPTLDNLNTTLNHTNEVLSHVDPILVQNREDIHTIVVEMRKSLTSLSPLLEQLKNTTDNNADNIDQIMLNLRITTENVRELTDSLKKNPSLIIRGTTLKDRKPGDPAK
jgi:phospholipid/cholesterol/gamma-HCH transport system substrate-binding protein